MPLASTEVEDSAFTAFPGAAYSLGRAAHAGTPIAAVPAKRLEGKPAFHELFEIEQPKVWRIPPRLQTDRSLFCQNGRVNKVYRV
jgi:hypothetical protein